MILDDEDVGALFAKVCRQSAGGQRHKQVSWYAAIDRSHRGAPLRW
jgi:hypothetical protein